MITEDLANCPKCKCKKALTHYSSDNLINWIACPKCKTFFEHGEEKEENNEDFWNQVIKDTGFKEGD